jgi:phenylalanyl-tRNA synthetase beta chain
VRVPLSWLREYVDVELSPSELREELTVRGMEVTAIEVSGAEWNDVVVGRLLEVTRHPNADTLWVTKVLTEEGGTPLEIVCGAQNIAPGQLVPVALPGAKLPGDRRIERTKIRGVVSNGMLCSPRELDLGGDSDGIKILGTHREYALGTDLRSIFGEVVLDVDVKPNRGDALSMVGLAREVAAFTGKVLRKPSVSLVETDDPTSAHVSVSIEDPDLAPRFTARWFDGVANGPSPDWMQRRLVAAGMRPVSAVVDVTNYVMHELGQPMHAYDGDTVPDGRIVVRRARPGEELVTIDHEHRTLDDGMLVIADAARAIGLAGIMGGAETEVTSDTRRVILESAVFHGPTIRNTARRLGLRSEASMRHEKGISWDVPRYAADRAAQLIAEITGASVAKGIVDNDPEPKPLRVVRGELARTERLLGIPVSVDRMQELLRPLEFDVPDPADTSGTWEVTVPAHRLDVVEAVDVAEEIARAHGYPLIPGRLPRAALPPYRPDPSEPRQRLRRVLAGFGLNEVVTHALIGADDLRRAGYDADDPGIVRVANPISEAHVLMRPVLYPSLLGSLGENARQRRLDAWIFEVGKTYHFAPDSRRLPLGAETAGKGRFEVWHVGVALLGSQNPAAVGSAPRDADIPLLKGLLEAMHTALGAPTPAYRPEPEDARHPHLHPGRAGRLVDPSGHDYGSVGEVDPRIARAWGLPGRPVMAVVNLPQLFALVPGAFRAAPVPAAQPIDRDLAVLVDDATPVGEVLRLVRSNAGPMLVEARLFDEYRGEQIGAGKVSYAIALRFQPEVPADEKGVEKALNRVRGALTHHLGAEIR